MKMDLLSYKALRPKPTHKLFKNGQKGRVIVRMDSGSQQKTRKERKQEETWNENYPVPSYLQSKVENLDDCENWSMELSVKEEGDEESARNAYKEALWRDVRKAAQDEAAAEPVLSSFLYASILAHNSFERALAFVLANRLADKTMLPTQLFEIFYDVLQSDEHVSKAAMSDMEAIRDRDPACETFSQAILYYKGYHAIQVHRIAHSLWNQGRKVMALALQSRISEVFAVDIHPAARLGRGILMDHGTGVVIGETAVIGNNVSMLQGVTLGGTGKEVGDRHPKIADNVLIGACATILGNISVGKGSQVAAGSLVLKPVPPRTMVAGSPAKEVGKVEGNPAVRMQHWMAKFKSGYDPFADPVIPNNTSSSNTTNSNNKKPSENESQKASQISDESKTENQFENVQKIEQISDATTNFSKTDNQQEILPDSDMTTDNQHKIVPDSDVTAKVVVPVNVPNINQQVVNPIVKNGDNKLELLVNESKQYKYNANLNGNSLKKQSEYFPLKQQEQKIELKQDKQQQVQQQTLEEIDIQKQQLQTLVIEKTEIDQVVESVNSDVEAKRKWPSSIKSEPEYFI